MKLFLLTMKLILLIEFLYEKIKRIIKQNYIKFWQNNLPFNKIIMNNNMKLNYDIKYNIWKVKYLVSYFWWKYYEDWSELWEIKCFNNKKLLNNFIKDLTNKK